MPEEKKKMNKGIIAGICAAVVAVIVAVVVVVVININKTNLAGTYALTAIIDSEGNESTESLEGMKAFGMDYELEFKDNSTGIFKVLVDSKMMSALVDSFSSSLTEDGEEAKNSEEVTSNIPSETSIDFTYDGKKMKLSSPIAGSAITEMDCEVKDGAVILGISDQKLKFTKK